MWRSVLTSAAALIVAGTVLWGGCVSCRQISSPGKAASDCCGSSGKCPAPAQKEQGHQYCKAPGQAAEQFVKTELAWTVDWSLPALAEAVVEEAAAPGLAPVQNPLWSPPEIFLLDSSFRI
jgi:hypothetical protein